MENRQRVAFAGERREGRKNDVVQRLRPLTAAEQDRKSTRLNSSHCNLVCRLLLEKKKLRPPGPLCPGRPGATGGDQDDHLRWQLRSARAGRGDRWAAQNLSDRRQTLNVPAPFGG